MIEFIKALRELSNAESIPCVGGRSTLPSQPGLKVKNRRISLPVGEDDLKWLCEQGVSSPFGKGFSTIHDREIRSSTEIEGHEVELLNPIWDDKIHELLTRVLREMGIDVEVRPDLYKLLIYQKGDHFKLHQDTEKSQGMFATLIVQLPSRCKGGALVCKFAGKEYQFDFGNSDGSSEFFLHYAVHYADVHHRVEPITEGARIVLVYNLIQNKGERPLSANYQQDMLSKVVNEISSIQNVLNENQHSFYLDHEYTEQSMKELGLSALKGKDRSLGFAIQQVNEKLDLNNQYRLYLTQATYSVTYSGYGGYYGDEEIGNWEEVESSTPHCELWFDIWGNLVPLREINIDWVHFPNQLIESKKFEDLDHDFWKDGDDDIEGYMGNYGPTKTTTYSRYLLVLIPAFPKKNLNESQRLSLLAYDSLLIAKDLNRTLELDVSWLNAKFHNKLSQSQKSFDLLKTELQSTNYNWNHNCLNREFVQAAKFLLQTSLEIKNENLFKSLLKTSIPEICSHFDSNNSDVFPRIMQKSVQLFGWKSNKIIISELIGSLPIDYILSFCFSISQVCEKKTFRSELMEIITEIVIGRSKDWGKSLGFSSVILPTALYLCDSYWYANQKSKLKFLESCIKFGKKYPHFLCVLIQGIKKEGKEIAWIIDPLVKIRLEWLEIELSKEEPTFSWSMPHAKVNRKDMNDFLKSNKESTQIIGFDGIAYARRSVIDLSSDKILPELDMESKGYFNIPSYERGFSASMTAGGRGKKAFVEIKKTREYYNFKKDLRKMREVEFSQLKG